MREEGHDMDRDSVRLQNTAKLVLKGVEFGDVLKRV
jgi:hypothetical protein